MRWRKNFLALSFALTAFTALSSRADEASPANVVSSVTKRIDGLVRAHWTEYEVRPSAAATDGEWLRRVFLDVIGRIPTLAEYSRFSKKHGTAFRVDVVKTLLYDEEYVAEYAKNWGTLWSNLLVGRGTGDERNSLVNREGLQTYLHQAFATNRAYDRMTQELIVATGNNKPGLEDFNGAVNFLAMKLGDKATQATADVSRLFLGKQVQCTQCHDHPFNDWKQNQFWELNSFFRQVVPLRRFSGDDDMVSHVELADQDFGGEGSTPEEAEVYYQLRDATLEAAYPVFINGTELPNRSGLVQDVNRRQELAKYILESEELPRAMVNRMWAHFFNRGFTTPVDDMGPHNPPTHPELLEFLATQFEQHSYDLRLLIQWIVTTEAYSLSSRMTKSNVQDDPSKGERPLFSHYYPRQMRAEELFDSLVMTTTTERVTDRRQYDEQRQKWLRQFVVAFGNDEGTEGSTFDGTITQSLVLFNGELVQASLSIKPRSWLHQLAVADESWEQKVDRLYGTAFCRKATNAEQNAARQILLWRTGNTPEALQDIWWAILNSNEFILNH